MEQMFISMLSKMTGLTAEEMQIAIKSMLELMVTIEQRFSRIEQKIDILLHECGAMHKIVEEPLIIEHKEKDKSNDG